MTARIDPRLYQLMAEQVQDYAIFLLDVDGNIASWNAGARTIKQYTADEIIGRHFSTFYTPSDIERNWPEFELNRAKLQGRFEDEGWRVRKDGSRFWARVAVTALYDGDGTLRGYAKVTQDLTQERHTQALEASAKELNDFIAILAHELRNPLAPIRHAVQLIETAGADEQARRMALGVIDRQSIQLARIVDDLLDVSRITRGMLSIRTERTEIASIVRRAIETVRPAAEAARHTLVVDLPATPIAIEADELRFTQAVVNVLGNAIRYTDPGGTISITARSTTAATEPRGSAVLEIGDNGRGIDPEFLPLVFSMFVQGKDPLKRSQSGLGVGLALARGIVELHHGTVTAKSEGPGKGAKFVIRLPLADASRHDAPVAPRAAARFQSRPRRVLVVDDNVDAALVLESLLRSHGHEVVAVHNGVDAIETFDTLRPDVVLLDIGMPGMNGFEVARRMRERNRTPAPFIVAVTGWGKAEDEARSRQAGFDMHLVKPVLEAKLLDALDAAVP